MKRGELKKFLDAVKTVRGTLTEEQALEIPDLFPAWRADRSYTAGDRVLYDGTLYKCLQDHTGQADWVPGDAVSLWAEVLTDPSGEILDWVQPDSTNAYQKGDKVRYDSKVYESLIDGNIWSPAAYPAGWQEITE